MNTSRIGICAVVLFMFIALAEQSSSCSGRCGDNFSSSHSCQCNDDCSRFGDCCSDYETICNAGSPGEITDQELLDIGDSLWAADYLRYRDLEMILKPEGQTLFSQVDESKLSHPSYALYIALLDNYNAINGQLEPDLTSHEQGETEAFLEHVVSSEVMMLVESLLSSKGKIQRGSMKDVLYNLWFAFYGRSSSMSFADSSGFEHVFVGEKKGSKVNGFHSWVQMYLLEKSGNIEYLGYNAKSEPDLMDNRLNWDGLYKARASMFIGTSPEFDMAIYTLCMIAKPGSTCKIRIGGNIVSIQTYDVSHESGLQVASAFPMVSQSRRGIIHHDEY